MISKTATQIKTIRSKINGSFIFIETDSVKIVPNCVIANVVFLRNLIQTNVELKMKVMDNEFANHEKDYIKTYQEKGYVSSFHIKDEKLINNETKNEYTPEDIHIVAEHRYEGMSNPSDMSILYVIETNKDEKGTVLMGYGPSADLDAAEFFKNIPKTNISDEKNINSD
ncbi:hypothetical protein [Algibacter sp. 2305UL17-15]|uniref:hypothetical protein n=1 Tax=Algibacter sp. 2305UL17-15 TaxID=3231268 RepID=UPI00345B1094